MAVDVLTDERRGCGRRNRVVPTPRRWRQASRRLQRPLARRWWQSSIGSPRRARISRKTIAQGRPECSPPQPVDFAPLREFFRARAHGCERAPGLSCALRFEEGQGSWHGSGKTRRENAISCSLGCHAPRMGGIQSSRDVSARGPASLECWIVRSSRTMTVA